MRLPDGMVERAARAQYALEREVTEPTVYENRLVREAYEKSAERALSAALSPEAIRELACGPCPFCEGGGALVASAEGPSIERCSACAGHGSLIAAWLAEDAVVLAAWHAPRPAGLSVANVADALSAAAGALSERSGG